jgi:long-chain acyl-CoA synthetase
MSKSREWPWLRSWPKNVPESIDYPEIPLGQVLRRAVDQAGDKAALYFGGREISYMELDKLADRFGAALQGMGVAKGDRVAVYLPNLPQFVFAYYGALRVGAVVVTVSPLYKERELSYILRDSGAQVLVYQDKLYPYVESVIEKTRPIQIYVTSANDYLHASLTLPDSASAKSLSALLAAYNDPPKSVDIDPKRDLALLQYTGGTTGLPKGAMLTHYNLVANAFQFSSWLEIAPFEVHLSVLPFFHIYGMTVAMNVPVYTAGAMILIPDGRDIAAVLQAVDTYRPAIFCGVPAMYSAMINQPDITQHDLRSIRVCVSGASPLPVSVQSEFEKLTGGRLVEGYGLTETSPVTHVNPVDEPGKNRSGSIGMPISDTEAKIVDLDTGVTLPPGTVGELIIRGPQVMIGYWNNAAETVTVLRDGWIYTGDIATMDSDGYFHIIDRKKDMINVSGLKVSPREVEEVLCEHPGVTEATAIAVPDPKSGEAVMAFVVLNDESKGRIEAADLIRFCRDRMAEYKAPRMIEFRASLPKSSVGKILRRELKPRPSQ